MWPRPASLAGPARPVRQWGTAFHRFNAWCRTGVWQRVFAAVQAPDLDWLMIDPTVVRARHHAAGPNGGADDRDLGRSRGGFGTKVPVAVEPLGLPPEIRLSPGQDADIRHAEAVFGGHRPAAVVADTGYDSDAFAKAVKGRGAAVVIPAAGEPEGAAGARQGGCRRSGTRGSGASSA